MSDFFAADGSITMIEGDSVDVRFQLSQDGTIPFDYTDYSIALKVATAYGKSAFLTLSLDNEKLLPDDPTNGWVRIALAPEDTEPLKAGEYVYELELATAGYRATLVQNSFTLEADIKPGAV